MKQDRELEPFGRLVEALNPWLGEVVIIGGWAHRLYRLDARSQKLTYPPLTTLDSDIAVPTKVAVKGVSIRDRLLAAGFQEEFVGEDRPPATHYHLRAHEGFYVEFLTPLVGSELCSNIENQYEFVLKEWAEDAAFVGPIRLNPNSRDPIIGVNDSAQSVFEIPQAGGPPLRITGFSAFVTTRAVAYCFLPSVTAVKFIAGLNHYSYS
jgi:nucleotidyltransferase-like protein